MSRSLFMLSGWAHTASVFDPLCALLPPELLPTGSGITELDAAGPEPPDYADALLQLLAAESPAPILLGWSTGGLIAIDVLARNPASAAALVLISSTARFTATEDGAYPHGTAPRELKAMARTLPRAPERTIEAFCERSAEPHTPIEAPADTARSALAYGIAPLSAGLSYLAQTDLRHVLSALSLPVLAIHGARDRIIPEDASRYLANGLKRCKLVIHPEAGHDLIGRYPDFVAEQLNDFLGEIR